MDFVNWVKDRATATISRERLMVAVKAIRERRRGDRNGPYRLAICLLMVGAVCNLDRGSWGVGELGSWGVGELGSGGN
ncbi:MAG: hypothetical protein AAGD25_31935 [Cyanobacteria bacterium P01_F01_bin.150]